MEPATLWFAAAPSKSAIKISNRTVTYPSIASIDGSTGPCREPACHYGQAARRRNEQILQTRAPGRRRAGPRARSLRRGRSPYEFHQRGTPVLPKPERGVELFLRHAHQKVVAGGDEMQHSDINFVAARDDIIVLRHMQLAALREVDGQLVQWFQIDGAPVREDPQR